jgi:predicted DNA binding CopG/RHH family protein
MTDEKKHTKSSIPDFQSREEEAAWFNTHDVSEFWDELTPVNVRFALQKPKEENIVVRVQKPIKERIERIAQSKGLNNSSLVRMWIMEKLQASH